LAANEQIRIAVLVIVSGSHTRPGKGIRKLIPVFRRRIPAMNEVDTCARDINRPEKLGSLWASTTDFESSLLKLSEQVLFARDKKGQNDKPNGSQTS
jgi:hypothetical protein